MHVNTGVSVAMFDLSRVAEMMSMSVESLLVPFITRLQMSLHVASSKSQRGSTTRQSVGVGTWNEQVCPLPWGEM